MSGRWRRWLPRLVAAVMACGVGVPEGVLPGAGTAQASDVLVQDAREAWRARDRARLLGLRDDLMAQRHALAPWVDFWWMQLRLSEAAPAEVDDFLARWGDAYVADRLRNDWLLELGRRKDWATFVRIQPAFRMNDDREVTCYGVLARQQLGVPMEGRGDLREQARQAWWSQKDPDTGCDTMAQALSAALVLLPDDVWRKLRLAADNGSPKVITQSARLLGEPTAQAVARLMGQPQAFLMNDSAVRPAGSSAPGATVEAPRSAREKARAKGKGKRGKEPRRTFVPPPPPVPLEHVGPLNLLALLRWGAQDPAAAAQALSAADAAPRGRLSREEQAWAWASLGRSAGWRLQPEAVAHFERALVMAELNGIQTPWACTWAPDTLAWMARTALRSAVAGQRGHWLLYDSAYDAMPADLQNDPTWIYWRARSLQAQAQGSTDPRRQQARDLLARIAQPTGFYGLLASEDLTGAPARPPARPAAPGRDELAAARSNPGLDRALRLYALGWRSEGAREWNYTLSFGKPGGLNDRELLAAASLACDQEIWDRCINTSERTRVEIDLEQRFPTPMRRDILAAARDVGLDPAYMFGLIRQESRVQLTARSTVGASGLMQVMPATAAWTARKLGMTDFQPEQITDRDVNLKIGAGYLKFVLDDFDGSQAMAAAAYNAGPSRPRRWREGARIEAAAWAESVPFNETRDYVKKVVANAVFYGHVLHGKPLSLKTRLGGPIGPRQAGDRPDNTDLP